MSLGKLWKGILLIFMVSIVRAEIATLDHLKGIVEVREVGQSVWRTAHLGDALKEGVSIRTALKSEASLVTTRGHRFKISSLSLFTLTDLNETQTKGFLEKGKVLSKVKPLHDQEKFSIKTPTAICAVRGTEFAVNVQEKGATWVEVYKGIVGVAAGDHELAVHAGERTSVLEGGILERSQPISSRSAGGDQTPLAKEARREVTLGLSREDIIAAAASEERNSDYREGKTLVDVEGKRVRLEEYIVRTPATANQFKFVVLNHRDDRLDYFFYHGTFNRDLPTDLSIALRDISGRYGTTAPDYYLTAYDMAQSNVRDSIHDTASGGHLIKIEMNSSGDFVLTDALNPTNTRTVTGAELLTDGTYKIYDPLSDSFSIVTAAQKETASHFGIYIAQTDTFRDFSAGDTFWKARFDNYTHAINNISKISYTPTVSGVSVLATRLDATYTYAGGYVYPVVQVDPNNVDATITNYYGDGTFERYRTVLINDRGEIAPLSAFSGISTGADYKGELLKWNYEEQTTATEFEGRNIDLVVEPKIFIKSGLIQ